MIKIALVDDHKLLRELLAAFINKFEGCTVILQAKSGKDLMDNINPGNLPDVLLLDINMPEIDGYKTAEWLKITYPVIRILILSQHDTHVAMIRLLRNDIRGFLHKDVDTSELERAIRMTVTTGFYYGPTTGKLLEYLKSDQSNVPLIHRLALSDREIQFLELASTQMTYKQIAEVMDLSARTVDNYRDQLFEKLDVNTRTGLVLMAVKSGLVRLDSAR
jgi:two-component system invasion response regulator UvrY